MAASVLVLGRVAAKGLLLADIINGDFLPASAHSGCLKVNLQEEGRIARTCEVDLRPTEAAPVSTESQPYLHAGPCGTKVVGVNGVLLDTRTTSSSFMARTLGAATL